MPLPSMPSACAIYRPFGTNNLVSGYPCRFVPTLWGGRGYHAGGNYLTWVGRFDLPAGADVRDGCGQTPGINAVVYGPGDEIRIQGTLGEERYVVVWVEERYRDTPSAHKRAYVMRTEPQW